jgi:hypothetical protein
MRTYGMTISVSRGSGSPVMTSSLDLSNCRLKACFVQLPFVIWAVEVIVEAQIVQKVRTPETGIKYRPEMPASYNVSRGIAHAASCSDLVLHLVCVHVWSQTDFGFNSITCKNQPINNAVASWTSRDFRHCLPRAFIKYYMKTVYLPLINVWSRTDAF